MGMVFGIQREEEPSYSVRIDASSAQFPYEVRSYGKRYAIEAAYDGINDDRSPFMKLAGYIGVLSDPQNEGETRIAMTAPVVMEQEKKKDNGEEEKKKGTAIAMTAPVAMQRDSATGSKKMQFILPSKYDSMEKIPKPTNPDVTVKAIEPSVGAVHRYSGTFSDTKSKAKATKLVDQLKIDGVTTLDEEKALETYQFWGYNPPFTLPMFRRNEVWVELTEDQVEELKKKKKTDAAAGASE